MLDKFPVHGWHGGPGHGKRGQLVVPTLTRECDPNPVDDRSEINLGSIVDDAPLESTQHLSGCNVSLEEHTQVGGQEVDGSLNSQCVGARVVGGECSKELCTWVSSQGYTNFLQIEDTDYGAYPV